MSASESYLIPDPSPSSDNDDVDSLPSISSSVLDSESESDAQQEWEKSLEEIQLLLTMVVVPFAGKYFGRRFAYWSTSPGCSLGLPWPRLTGELHSRLGEVHGVGARRRGPMDEQTDVPGDRSGRGGGDIIDAT